MTPPTPSSRGQQHTALIHSAHLLRARCSFPGREVAHCLSKINMKLKMEDELSSLNKSFCPFLSLTLSSVFSLYIAAQLQWLTDRRCTVKIIVLSFVPPAAAKRTRTQLPWICAGRSSAKLPLGLRVYVVKHRGYIHAAAQMAHFRYPPPPPPSHVFDISDVLSEHCEH